MKRLLFSFYAVFVLLHLVYCIPNKIDIKTCGEAFEDLVCTINEVKVDSCMIDKGTKACKLKRGSFYTMNVDFIPDFEGDDITLMAYALLPGGTDASFPGMDDNACHWMKCPVVKNTVQTYTFNLTMSGSYPTGMFNVRWLMKQAGEPKCCFQNRFRIE